jgi:hypothetical protein
MPAMKTLTAAVLVGTCVGAVAIAAVVTVMRRRAVDEKVTKYDRLCMATKMAMQDDRRAFLSGDPKQQDAAYVRFYGSDALYHGEASIAYCLDEAKIPKMPLECQLNKDWKCLADVAAKIEQALP